MNVDSLRLRVFKELERRGATATRLQSDSASFVIQTEVDGRPATLEARLASPAKTAAWGRQSFGELFLRLEMSAMGDAPQRFGFWSEQGGPGGRHYQIAVADGGARLLASGDEGTAARLLDLAESLSSDDEAAAGVVIEPHLSLGRPFPDGASRSLSSQLQKSELKTYGGWTAGASFLAMIACIPLPPLTPFAIAGGLAGIGIGSSMCAAGAGGRKRAVIPATERPVLRSLAFGSLFPPLESRAAVVDARVPIPFDRLRFPRLWLPSRSVVLRSTAAKGLTEATLWLWRWPVPGEGGPITTPGVAKARDHVLHWLVIPSRWACLEVHSEGKTSLEPALGPRQVGHRGATRWLLIGDEVEEQLAPLCDRVAATLDAPPSPRRLRYR